jgi:hypothetical protein
MHTKTMESKAAIIVTKPELIDINISRLIIVFVLEFSFVNSIILIMKKFYSPCEIWTAFID